MKNSTKFFHFRADPIFTKDFVVHGSKQEIIKFDFAKVAEKHGDVPILLNISFKEIYGCTGYIFLLKLLQEV